MNQPAMNTPLEKAQKWEVVRWKDGVAIDGSGDSTTARHLYKGGVWQGVLKGTLDDTEEMIINAINKYQSSPPSSTTKELEYLDALREVSSWLLDLTLRCITTDIHCEDIKTKAYAIHRRVVKDYRKKYDLKSEWELNTGKTDPAIEHQAHIAEQPKIDAVPQCKCFDAEGWRELIDGVDTIELGDFLNYNDVWEAITRESGSIGRVFDESIFVPCKTRRHLPDCPDRPRATQPRDSKAEEDIFPPKEKKPKLDLSGEIKDLKELHKKPQIALEQTLISALQKIEAHINGL